MNIIEAVKSGKSFRRPGGKWYFQPTREDYYFAASRRDFLADDWEVEEKKVEITYERLRKAFEKVRLGLQANPYDRPEAIDIAKELGLIE